MGSRRLHCYPPPPPGIVKQTILVIRIFYLGSEIILPTNTYINTTSSPPPGPGRLRPTAFSSSSSVYALPEPEPEAPGGLLRAGASSPRPSLRPRACIFSAKTSREVSGIRERRRRRRRRRRRMKPPERLRRCPPPLKRRCTVAELPNARWGMMEVTVLTRKGKDLMCVNHGCIRMGTPTERRKK